jgi:hypothetical protein
MERNGSYSKPPFTESMEWNSTSVAFSFSDYPQGRNIATNSKLAYLLLPTTYHLSSGLVPHLGYSHSLHFVLFYEKF